MLRNLTFSNLGWKKNEGVHIDACALPDLVRIKEVSESRRKARDLRRELVSICTDERFPDTSLPLSRHTHTCAHEHTQKKKLVHFCFLPIT